ncbi:hypothetical protein [Bradyrhizobium sp.]
MKVFWAWQSDHPRKISRDVIRTALEAAVEHLKQERGVVEAPEESRSDLYLDHDTKGLTGSPDVARSILEKIQASTVFVGDVTPVGKTPDVPGNEGSKPGRPLINSNVAIEYGFALRKLTDSAVVGVMNEAYGEPKDLPFDIIHKRWPVRYRLVEGATNAEIDAARNHLKGQFVTALKGFIDKPESEEIKFDEIPPQISKAFYFANGETLGHCNQIGDDVYMPFREVLYMRLIPTKPLPRPVGERAMISAAMKYGAMGSAAGQISISNQYGAMCFSPAGNTNNVDTLTQYFPNGEVWAIDAHIMRSGERGDENWYVCTQAEDAFVATLENGLNYLRKVAGAELPIKVVSGVVGIRGRRLVIPGRALHLHGRMMTNEVEIARVLHDDSIDAQDKYLIQLFERIFDQSGAPRPKGLNGFPKAQGL